MMPKLHMYFGFLFSALLFHYFPAISFFGASIIFLASFLIDVDHYIYYVAVKKDLSLKNAYNYNLAIRDKHGKRAIRIFHTIEFLLLLGISSYFYKLFLFLFIGFAFHIMLDVIDSVHRKTLSLKHFSVIAYFKRLDK